MRLILATSLLASLWTAQAFAQVDDVWVVPSYGQTTQAAPAPPSAAADNAPPTGSDSWWFNVGFNIAEADNCRFITNDEMEAALNENLTQQGDGDTVPINVQNDINAGSEQGRDAALRQPANCGIFLQATLASIRQDAINWNGK